MPDFAFLPPEINSGLMYSGAGAGPMLAAAAAWGGLATELSSIAASYQSVIAGLTGGPWQGPASVSMAAAAASHVAWLNGAAAQAEHAATQAAAAAGAYESAFAGTVPPEVIAVNRALLSALVATNFLGQNTPAIMATEALYLEMWAQDAATMFGYAGASAAASTFTPFTPPTPTASLAGLATQAATVTAATGGSVATNTQAMLTQLTTTVPLALAGLASSTSSTSPTSELSSVLNLVGLSGFSPSPGVSGLVGLDQAVTGSNLWKILGLPTTPTAALTTANTMAGLGANSVNGMSLSGWSSLANSMMPKAAAAAAAALPNAASNMPAFIGGPGLEGVGAGLGRASSIGGLSVPQSWGATVPTTAPAVTALPLNGAQATYAGGPASMLGGLPLAGVHGQGMATSGTPRYGFQLSVVPRPPSAG